MPILLLTSSSAILNALTIVSDWPLAEPVRGRLETILIVPLRAAAGLGEGLAATAGEPAGLGDGDTAGAAGLGGSGALVAAGPGAC